MASSSATLNVRGRGEATKPSVNTGKFKSLSATRGEAFSTFTDFFSFKISLLLYKLIK